jgi:glucosamine--fructose-6-phosphate aminotransferase (isomerizing)
MNVFSIWGTGKTLPWMEPDDPICDAIAMLLPDLWKAARDCGLDPDNPPHLTKITKTLSD